MNPEPPPDSFGGFDLNSDQTRLREQEMQTGGPPGTVRVGVYGPQAELMVITTEQSLTESQIKIDLMESAKTNSGTKFTQIGDVYCMDIVATRNVKGSQCEASADSHTANVILLSGTQQDTANLTKDVLNEWW